MSAAPSSAFAVCLTLARAISHTRTVEEIYEIALDALSQGLGVSRAAVLLFDAGGVMRFKAHRGLSAAYRAAVEGHTPWRPEHPDPAPIVVADVTADASLAPYLSAIRTECIAALAFIPLVSRNRVIGKFMLYYNSPHQLIGEELQLACLIASHVAFAVERTRAEEQARLSEERLRFALDAASMGTWDWDMTTHAVRWSDNLERLHGLPPGTFDGTFASYQREIHPDDRERLQAGIRQAMADGLPFEAEYRIVAPDGTVRWCQSSGRVEFRDRRPVRMTGVCVMVTTRKEAELARLAAAEEASRVKVPAGSRSLVPAAERQRVDERRDPVRLEGARIVVVDDERDARDLLATLFEQHGASVVKCDSVDAALAAMDTARVDLLVADIAMPDVDGYELVRRAKALSPGLPAVAVSAHARAEDRGRALASGYDGYCAKPIDTPSLLRTVHTVMLS